jgi:hypothetical protein
MGLSSITDKQREAAWRVEFQALGEQFSGGNEIQPRQGLLTGRLRDRSSLSLWRAGDPISINSLK